MLKKVMAKSNIHITNINRLLKEIKSNIFTNYICSDNKEIVIMTNKVAAMSDLNIIKKYVKKLNNVNITKLHIEKQLWDLCFCDSNNFSNYFIEDTELSITPDIIESIIKSTYIFNNIVFDLLSSSYQGISKSNMAIIWINIWDSQNYPNTKCLINRYFNLE